MNASSPFMVWLQVVALLAGEVALAVGAAAVLQRFTRSAGWRRTIWQVCLFSLLVLPMFELTGAARGLVDWLVSRAESPFRVADTPHAAEQSAGRELPPPVTFESGEKVADRVARNKQSDVGAPLKARSRRVQARAEFPPQAFAQSATSRMPSPTKGEASTNDSVADSMAVLYLGLVWLVGVSLVIARSSIAGFLLLLFRWRRQAAADMALAGRVVALARTLGMARRVRLIESARLAGPIAFGVFRPVIGLPTGFAERFSPVQQEAMLAHELAHLASHDPAWYLLANWASAILWWHPLVWWARRRLHAASETAADEASLVVVDGPVALAECLAEMGARLTQKRSFVWMGVEGNGLRSGLGQRVERLVLLRGNSCASPNRLRSALAKTLGSAALIAAVILSTAWVGPQAFTKGESMKTMKQTWSRSLAAFALLATIESEDTATRANGLEAQRDSMVGRAHVTTGKWLFDSGKLDEAEARMKEGLKENPTDPTAIRYLRLIEEQRYAQNARGQPAAESSTAPGPAKPVAARLDKIVLNEVLFDGVPLPEVLKFLDEESRKRDPEKKGINFLINPNTTQSAPASVIDPQTGQVITVPPQEPMDMNSVVVRFNLPLRNVRLKDVLDAIVRVADKPIEYSIEEYGVLLSQAASRLADPTATSAAKSLEAAPLQVRTFKLDADKLLPGLKRAFGINLEGLPPDRSDKTPVSPEGSVENLRKEIEQLEKTLSNLLAQFTDQHPLVVKVRAQIDALKESLKGKLSYQHGEERKIPVALRQLLTQLGVNMDVPGKALFYNDLTGILMVRASHEDLEIIQAAIETLGGESERKAANSVDKTSWASRPHVMVLGEVNKGGGIPIRSGQRLTLRDALAAAGGLTRTANKNHINVIHGGNQVSKFRYDAILTATDAADNPVLADGDVVKVP